MDEKTGVSANVETPVRFRGRDGARLNVALLKSARLQGLVGSNPTAPSTYFCSTRYALAQMIAM